MDFAFQYQHVANHVEGKEPNHTEDSAAASSINDDLCVPVSYSSDRAESTYCEELSHMPQVRVIRANLFDGAGQPVWI